MDLEVYSYVSMDLNMICDSMKWDDFHRRPLVLSKEHARRIIDIQARSKL